MTSVPPAPDQTAPHSVPGYGASPYPPAPAAPKTNVLAIVAFVGVFFVSLVGIICGHIALSQLKRTGEAGRGFALAAVIIGYCGLVVGFFAAIFWIVAIAAAATVGGSDYHLG